MTIYVLRKKKKKMRSEFVKGSVIQKNIECQGGIPSGCEISGFSNEKPTLPDSKKMLRKKQINPERDFI
jgi:hypothetical protein